ncbi:MAG: 50S ribosomal protein L3 [Planctomycetes bacterium]|nr:50S ribosomal protein L3 [Planctomycetota bacterium]
MAVGLLGRKIGMTQVYAEDGSVIPVTVIEAGPCTVLQVRTVERDQYAAVQLGFGAKPRRLASRSERGHVASIGSKRAKARTELKIEPVAKADCEPPRFIREFRLEEGDAAYEVGQKLTLDLLSEVARVDVIGMIKGRGHAGVMKQHNFGGLRASHGVQRHHRAGGSIGSHGCDRGNSGKIKKGKRMAGRWGNERVTARNLKVVRVDVPNNVILVYGAVPGPNGGHIMIRNTKKKRKSQPK